MIFVALAGIWACAIIAESIDLHMSSTDHGKKTIEKILRRILFLILCISTITVLMQ